MTLSRADLRTVNETGEGSEPTRLEKGAIIRRRWLDAGFKSKNDFANKSPFDRKTLTKIEAGTAELATYERVMAWLDNYTGESAEPSREQLTFTVEGQEVTVTVRGPVADREQLKRDAAELFLKIRESSPEDRNA
jgi:hypothetical protein